MKTPERIEQAVTTLTEIMQEATGATITYKPKKPNILDKIREKRKAKVKWRKHTTYENKKHLYKLAKEIKSKIKDHNSNEFSKFIETLSVESHEQNKEVNKTNPSNQKSR